MPDEDIRDAMNAAEGYEEPFEKTVRRLATLPILQYERCRKSEAKRLKLRAAVLDREVAAIRTAENGEEDGLGLFEPVPWHEEVNGEDLLHSLVGAITQYVVMPPHGALLAALWVIHCHAPEYWRHTPRLNITAPEKGCGKSTLLDVLLCLVPRGIKTENLSTAVLFRAVDRYRPTLLIDEVDSFLRENEELRGCLNAGHAQGGRHLRCEGDNNEIKGFKTFAPAALAGIGNLPVTLADRSLPIILQKRRLDEHVREFHEDEANNLRELASQCARWVQDREPELRTVKPAMPGGIQNRLADNWRPLFAIAQVAGGNWPNRVSTAAIAMASDPNDEIESISVMLLSDIRSLFDKLGTDRLASEHLVNRLHEMEDRLWPEYGRQRKPITKVQVARLLRRFRISPGTIREGSETYKGYKRKQFEDVFSRYLAVPNVTPTHPSEAASLRANANRHNVEDVTVRKSQNATRNTACDGVTAEMTEDREQFEL